MDTDNTTSNYVIVTSTLTERQSLIKRLLAEDKITFEEALVLLIPTEDAPQQHFYPTFPIYPPGPYDVFFQPYFTITC